MTAEHRSKLALIIWLCAMLVLLGWSAANKLVTFDHDGRLYLMSQQHNFDEIAATRLLALTESKGPFAIHFEGSECMCQWVAKPHIESVKKLAVEHGYENIVLNANSSEAQKIAEYMPITPAIALLNEKGELVYLGPYSTGIYCTKGKGLVEPFIQGNRMTLNGPAIPYDAEGCYCEN